ncbi:MAG: RNA polymerase sigma factor (sigma-70 family) [Roseivirga sp.]|jgi:RNA polymerase sigma factor (sigma-70 family)
MKPTDEELVILFQQEGNSRFFEILVTRYRQRIYLKCLGYVKNKDTAEDLCQDIFAKIFQKIDTFRRESLFTTWLYAITHNECLNYLRSIKKSSHEVITEKLADKLEEIIEEDEVDAEVSEESLMLLLEELTREDKLILLLKYKDKQPIKEIQKVLGLSESAVKMRLKRAKERINKLYISRK